jgi:transposase
MARHDPAKIKMAELMLAGANWQEAVETAGVVTSRASAYRFVTAYCLHGEAALADRRGGHAYKVVDEVLAWLLEACRARPDITGRELQGAVLERYNLQVSKGYLNQVRAAHGVSQPPKKRA